VQIRTFGKTTTGLIGLFVWTVAAYAISLTEYTYPVSRSQDAYVSGNFNSSGSSQDSTQTSYNLGGTASYNYFFRSLPLTYQFNTTDNIAIARSPQLNDPEKGSYNFDFSARANKYLSNESKIFGFGALHANYLKDYANQHAFPTYEDATAGAGYGRTVNATVLKQAIRMSDDFKRFFVTKGDIPDDVLLKLARIIDNESEYSTMYGPLEYRKYWYNDMEDVLKDSGVLIGDRLGAMGILRIQEVLDEPTGIRTYGWEVRAGVGVVLQDYRGEKGNPLVSVEYDWSRPVSITLQLNNSIYANTVFYPSSKDSASIYNLGNKFQIYYEFSNRIHWDNQLNLFETLRTKSGQKNAFTGQLSSTFQFYIENQLSFNTGIVVNRNDNGIDIPITNWTLTSGINYRLR